MRNILVREEDQKVYVQCRDCGALVARYILAVGGYYHAGKAFESFLRSIERDGGESSGKDIKALFDNVQSDSADEFAQVQVNVKERYGNDIP